MGQGQDKIARSLLDLQPTAIVELFLLYFNTVDKEDAFIAFHGGAIYNQGITWQGIEYLPIPVETEGFEVMLMEPCLAQKCEFPTKIILLLIY